MNKFGFIKSLLENEKFNVNQKERFLSLVAKELEISEVVDKSVLKDIMLIKDKLGLPNDNDRMNPLLMEELMKGISIDDLELFDNEELQLFEDTAINSENNPKSIIPIDKLNSDSKNKDSTIKAKKVNVIEYLNPKDLSQFLHDFNQNPILKTTCHLIDSNELKRILDFTKKQGYDYKTHKKKIEQEYYKLANRFGTLVSSNMRTQIGEYLNGYLKGDKKGWSEDSIKINWSSQEIKSWCGSNPHKCPTPDGLDYIGCEFAPLELRSGDVLNKFSDLVLHFKKQIQFRQGHSLRDAINEVNFIYRGKAIFDIAEVRDNLQLFTDTEKVKQAYKRIIKMSIDHFEETQGDGIKPEFKLMFTEKEEKIIFSIHNTNSVFGKTLANSIRPGRDITGLIESQINGLCDFCLRADFGSNEYGVVYYWPEKNHEMIDSFKGVEFKMIFYRPE